MDFLVLWVFLNGLEPNDMYFIIPLGFGDIFSIFPVYLYLSL